MSIRNSLIGSPIERLEDLRFLRGRGEYVDDLVRPGLLHAAILRSPVAHGRIRAIETTPSLARPGVHAVLTAVDFGAAVPRIPLRQEPLLAFRPYEQPVVAVDRVRYVGEPLAVVIADHAGAAEDALEHVALDIEPLAAVTSREAAASGTVPLFDAPTGNRPITLTALRGDADAAFRTADYVRRERFVIQRHSAITMEPRGLLAEWDAAAGRLTVWGASKVPFAIRRVLAGHLGLPVEAIRMVENDTGGSFGVRGEYYPEDCLIPFAARCIGRPIKWIEDRRENFLASNHARDMACDVEIACRRDGTVLAMRGRADVDIGAYVRTNAVTPPRNVAQVISGPYSIASIRFDASMLVTNKTPAGTYRGPGRFEADFCRERLFDMAARDLGIDRLELRRRNLIAASEMPYQLPVILPYNSGTACDSGDYRTTFERCLQEFGWSERAQHDGRLVDGRYHGLGIGCYIESGASGPKENARLELDSDGSVSVLVGSSAVGQGLETVFAQIAADALELPLARISAVHHGSTDHLAEGYGTYGSRTVVMGGSAILDAAAKLRRAIAAAAARRLGCDPDTVSIVEGRVVAADGRALTFAELADERLRTEGSFASDKRTYSYGTHAAHVAVDAKTGRVEVLDYASVEDVGRIINPATVHGQTLGAIVQGLGGALLEHLAYDEDGQLLTASYADYLVPTAGDFPSIKSTALELAPSPNNPLGAKGAAEGGIIPVAGVIANAVASALSSLGAEPCELPLSPARIWELIRSASADGTPATKRSDLNATTHMR
ncbi:MAG: xanthine dehydrogenase family protein molybdopterin-binding subunit [Hyphomicrobiales bacterium]|nr:xanthine dehydrogenase family protein molybdopterin-binding subunit [Hyphomicrobiales bacterium]